jgi:3-oxoacyl-[acyl-carrier protein] reductase
MAAAAEQRRSGGRTDGMNTLEGRTAIVTGASKGIGAGIAMSLAAAGATVVVNYRADAEAAERVVGKISAAGGRALAVQADVSRTEDVARLFATARSACGPVSILVNNAGVYTFAPLAGITEADFHRLFAVNVLGPLLTMKAFAGQDDADGGTVINIATVGISSAPPMTALYTATKAALASTTLIAAKELAPRRIRVNAIAPASSDTDGTRALGVIGTPAEAQFVAPILLGRLGLPEDIGPVAAFLASDAARFITGEIIFVSGGDR